MATAVAAVPETATCAEALELMDRGDLHLLPVTDGAGRVVGTLSLPHLGGIFIPRVKEPRLMRQVHGSLADIARALEEFYVRLGTMDIRSFWKISEREGIPAAQSIINYPHIEKDEIFDLPRIVSRKKQLIPYLTSLLKETAG